MNRTTTDYTNRLIHATSPYLLQHAHNPVDWYPWGGEAFERARKEDKPIFLSVGYSACHWCHVMEAESFADEATAAILNAHFVAIKVDREERPDVDETYMKAVQMLTGSGGWPLSVFLTPDGKPFYGGTYFAPRAGFGRPSFRQVLDALAQAWRDRREELLASAGELVAALEGLSRSGAPMPLSLDTGQRAFDHLSAQFDEINGGFGEAPKFPQPNLLAYLLTYWHRTGEPRALDMVTRTLDAMRAGGIHDHLGGGFHRYATDAHWLVPHFEKMLYDQALLARVYVQACQATGRQEYGAVARDVLDYILRDMTDPEGGFYAAEDADSEGREGAFYVWSREEIVELLGMDVAEALCDYYGVTASGNFEAGKSILYVTKGPEPAGLEQARRRLLEHRQTRVRPSRDDKVITAWNGLMISALAYAGAVLSESRYVAAAGRAADYILGTLRVDGRLMRYSRFGRVVGRGFLDDYACMLAGLIDLYEASFETRWLAEAVATADQMLDLFADRAGGAFFLAGRDAECLVVRDRPTYDGAVPSGNSVAALGLLKLGRLTASRRFTAAGQNVLEACSSAVDQSPTGFTALLQALDYAVGSTQEIVIAGSQRPSEAAGLLECIRRHFLPTALVLFHPTGPEAKPVERMAPFVTHLGPMDGRAVAYVCENYACRQPVMHPADLDELLGGISRKD